ncbi:MAG: hypothetical protein M1834_000106 [Cirrosporium novae-zelandiae]|nr:MAG: hypothetical protein M1834_000106 [Cirrosporium novae-zelandiae]
MPRASKPSRAAKEVMNSSRKSHRKSRTGCSHCKRRKIKVSPIANITSSGSSISCDEEKPACRNCIKHAIECDFLTKSTVISTTPASSARSASRCTSVSPSASDNISTPHNNTPSSESNTPALPLNMVDLELLHNFSTSTCITLSRSPEIRNLWRINIPQLAFSHEFVMHGILALSALHLAQFRPEKRDFYLSQATSHHETALRVATAILPCITKENCTALHVFSSVTCIATLAKPRDPGNFFLIGDEGVAGWLSLIRGSRSIIESSWQWLYVGPLAPMFQIPMRQDQLQEASNGSIDEEHLVELCRLIHETITDQKTLKIYIESIKLLSESFALVYKRGPGFSGSSETFRWIFRIPEEYLLLLNQRKPEALSMFAYFCVLLKQMDFFWWMQGWSTHLISGIYHLLDDEYRLWIRWPIEEIGWVPT